MQEYSDSKRLITPREAARLLHVADSTVRRWCEEDLIEAQQLPSRGKKKLYRIYRSAVDRMLGKIAKLPQ